MHKIINSNVAVAIILNKNHEILLQKKTMDYSWAPGKWTFFGGAIEKDETAHDALKRELKEELGISDLNGQLIKTINYKDELTQMSRFGNMHLFLVEFNRPLTDVCLNEGAGFAFFSKEEINQLNLIEYVKDIILDFFENH